MTRNRLVLTALLGAPISVAAITPFPLQGQGVSIRVPIPEGVPSAEE